MKPKIPREQLAELQDELSALFGGRSVDLVTPKFLNHRIRDEVLKTAEVQYAAGDVDFDVVWSVVTADLPVLISLLEPIVPPAPDGMASV